MKAVLVGASCAAFNASVVILAALLTAAVVVGMVLFTLQTKVFIHVNKHTGAEFKIIKSISFLCMHSSLIS